MSWEAKGSIGDIGPKGLNQTLTIGIIGTGQLGGFLQNYLPPKKLISEQYRDLTIISYGPTPPLTSHVFYQGPNIIVENLCCNLNSIDYNKRYQKGDLSDIDAIVEFGKKCDIITYEIENIPVEALEILQNQYNKKVYPDPQILKIIQNKYTQKQFLINNNFLTSSLISIDEYPMVLKTETGGYDGRGVQICKNETEIKNSKLIEQPHFFEEFTPIKQEISIIIGRNPNGYMFLYDPVMTVANEIHQLDYLVAPAQIPDDQISEIREITKCLAETLNLVGIMAVEFFISQRDNKIYINEISPRPHNTGHHTIDCYPINQYELLHRCLMNVSLTDTFNNKFNNIRVLESKNDILVLTNLTGRKEECNIFQDTYKITPFFHPDFKIYSYGKTKSFPGRKLGHITVRTKKEFINPMVISGYSINSPCSGLSTAHRMKSLSPHNIKDFVFRMKHAVHLSPPIPSKHPIVAIIMGSSSDLSVMDPAIQILHDFHIPYEVQIVSAHRTPKFMQTYAETAQQRGIQIIIAGAGGAAHLPGMVASNTILPVIGVPIKSSNSYQGLDSLLSICQMPSGIPVATMAINGSKNAGLLAVRMLLNNDQCKHLKQLLILYQLTLEEKVVDMNYELNGLQI